MYKPNSKIVFLSYHMYSMDTGLSTSLLPAATRNAQQHCEGHWLQPLVPCQACSLPLE